MKTGIAIVSLALLFSACASLTTTALKPTDTVRNAATTEKSVTLHFSSRQYPNTTNPNLTISIARQVTSEETFQRHYIEKRRLKQAVRVTLWATGAAIAGGGFYLYDQAHWSRLGELVMGAGGLIPLGGEIITASLPPVREEWKEENLALPPRVEPGVRMGVKIDVGTEAWIDTTDEEGMLQVDISPLADDVPFGEALAVRAALNEDSTVSATFTVPAAIVDAWRTPPVVEFATMQDSVFESEHIRVPIRLSKPWHNTIRFTVNVLEGSESLPADYHDPDMNAIVIMGGSLVEEFAPEETLRTVSLMNPDDEVDEGDEHGILHIRLGSTDAVLGTDTTFFYTILDDDEPPLVQFAAATSRGGESVSPGRLVVSLSNASGWDIRADYAVKGGTAEGQGVDYYLDSGTVAIPAGAASASIEILIIDDAQMEGEESIVIFLSNPLHASLGEYATHTYIIADNDEATPVAPVASATAPETLSSPSATTTIAILDFQGIGVSAQEAMVLTNRLGTHMVQLGRYQVIERGQMEQILTEQDFQMTGCTSNECAVEIGQLIGAGQMLAGSFGRLGTVYTIDMRIIDVLTGRITKTTSYDIEGSINRLLTEGLAEAVKRIAGVE